MNLSQGHVCPPSKKGALQYDAFKAASSGDVDKVNAFVDGGGDVNGADLNGMTMLNAACYGGHKEVVRQLLKRPEIHLNTRHMMLTALGAASAYGHEECVKLLLGYKGKCDLNLRMKSSFGGPITALCASALRKHWNIFSILLKETVFINPEEVSLILKSALDDNHWDVIQEILQTDIQYVDDIFLRLLNEAYISQLFDTIHVVFQRALHHDNYSVLRILGEMFQRKDWNNLEPLLKCMTQSLKVDVPLAEALSSKRHKEVEGMLREKNFDADTMSGIFLLACIGGASEEVTQLLMTNASNYTGETLKYALLLTSTFDRLELLSHLLQLDMFSFKIINCAYNSAVMYNFTGAMKILKVSLSNKACEMFPKMLNCLKLDITNDDE